MIYLSMIFVGRTLLSDLELVWTPLMFELPNAPRIYDHAKKLQTWLL